MFRSSRDKQVDSVKCVKLVSSTRLVWCQVPTMYVTCTIYRKVGCPKKKKENIAYAKLLSYHQWMQQESIIILQQPHISQDPCWEFDSNHGCREYHNYLYLSRAIGIEASMLTLPGPGCQLSSVEWVSEWDIYFEPSSLILWLEVASHHTVGS